MCVTYIFPLTESFRHQDLARESGAGQDAPCFVYLVLLQGGLEEGGEQV